MYSRRSNDLAQTVPDKAEQSRDACCQLPRDHGRLRQQSSTLGAQCEIPTRTASCYVERSTRRDRGVARKEQRQVNLNIHVKPYWSQYQAEDIGRPFFLFTLNIQLLGYGLVRTLLLDIWLQTFDAVQTERRDIFASTFKIGILLESDRKNSEVVAGSNQSIKNDSRIEPVFWNTDLIRHH